MDFKVAKPRRFAFAVALRSVLIGGLAFLLIQLLATTQLYATALLIFGVGVLVTLDLMQIVKLAERAAQHELRRLGAQGNDASSRALPLPGTTFADRASNAPNAAQSERQQQFDYIRTLLDTVAAALLVMRLDGSVSLANRSARTLAGAPVSRLEEIDAIGASGAQKLLALAPGTRQIVTLAEGRQMFVSVSQFATPGREPQRLLSLQRIAGELDAVELKAWQDMVDVLAHEMMNSLTPIASLSEGLETLLRDSQALDSAGEVAGALEAIRRRSVGLMDFVERYRAVAKLPAPKRQPLRMDQFLSGIHRLLAPTFEARRVAYTSSIEPLNLSFLADPQLLEQAVSNLLRNATDAVAASEQPQIDVDCRLHEGQLTLTITDNGCGVPMSLRDQIFVPFFTTKPGSSGIGLNLARHIVTSHGGELTVRANHPQGSVFTLILPAVA